MNTAIIGGGIIEAEFVSGFILEKRFDCIIAADRGLQFCYEQNIMPNYILGDYDSIDPKILDWYKSKSVIPVAVFPAEKDDTDGALAFQKAIEIGSDCIYFLGALGGRMDHAIANIHLLKSVLNSGQCDDTDIEEYKNTDTKTKDKSGLGKSNIVEAYIVDSKNMICLVSQEKVLQKDKQFGKYVSFLPLTDIVEGVTLKGFKYPLKEYTMEKGKSIGVSNEIVEKEAKVTLRKGLLLMIQSRD